METAPLLMSRDLKEVEGRPRAVQMKARAMDLWVMMR